MSTHRDDHKSEHGRILGISGAIAFLLHAVAFGIWPEYVPNVYQLPQEELPEVVPIWKPPPAPPEPEEIPLPEIPVEADVDEVVDEEQTIVQTSWDLTDLPHLPPDPHVDQEIVFLPFDEKPIVLHKEKPEYPELARRANLQGRVNVVITIDERGRVVNAEVIDSTCEVFNQAAIDAAYKWRFRPAMQRDVPVSSKIAIPFQFSLR